ncbi:hypothetical protein B7939_00475 [Eggerthia catenaformis]|nr:hypothetical protein B7939_00475 [Eggerthia catenaformis]
MMNISDRFNLLVDNSEIIELDVEQGEYDLFLNDVSGLNHTLNNEYINLGTKYIKINDKQEQKKITLSLILSGSHDEVLIKYYDLINKINSYIYSLELLYLPFEKKDIFYRAKTNISSIERKWMNSNSIEVSISFNLLENFYIEKTYYLNNEENEINQGFIFNKSKFDIDIMSNVFSSSIVINNDLSFSSGCQIFMLGQISQPEWVHYVNGRETARGKLNADIDIDKILMIDTLSIPYKIMILDKNFNELNDYYQFRDFNLNEWAIMLKPGQNRIALNANNTNKIKAIIKTREENICV